MSDTDRWQDRANCVGMVDAMYPPLGPDGHGQYAVARRVCQNCDVMADCLAYALAAREQDGMWGGLTPTERRRLIRVAS